MKTGCVVPTPLMCCDRYDR